LLLFKEFGDNFRRTGEYLLTPHYTYTSYDDRKCYQVVLIIHI